MFDLLCEQFTEMVPIPVGAKDCLSFISPGGDMIPPIGALDSRSTGHEGLRMGKSINCQTFPPQHLPPAALVEKPGTSLQNEKM